MAIAPLTPKMKIILPLIGSVAAVMLFLLLVWPTGPTQKKGQAQTKRQNHTQNRQAEDSRGAGWRADKPDRKGTRPEPKGESWWYQDEDSKKSKGAKSDWWYKD
jgi:hypothetical protein